MDNGDGTESRPPEEAAVRYYHDVDPALRQWALARLRPQASRPREEPSPLERWPDVPSSYVVCADDRAMDPLRCRRAARELLGIDAIDIPGSHSPFLSRPAALAEILTTVASA